MEEGQWGQVMGWDDGFGRSFSTAGHEALRNDEMRTGVWVEAPDGLRVSALSAWIWVEDAWERGC